MSFHRPFVVPALSKPLPLGYPERCHCADSSQFTRKQSFRSALASNPYRWGLLALASALLATQSQAAEQPVVVDKAHSQIEIVVKATMDSFTGKLTDFAPTVTVNPVTGEITSANVRFHFNDVKTGNEKRDHEMHVWQQTEQFPDGIFKLNIFVPLADGKSKVIGTLTLHGITAPLSFPVTVTREGSTLTVAGEAVVDTQAYGLPIIRKFALLKVDPLVVVRFHLSGTIPAP